MDFGKAIRELKNGKSLYRKGWNGKGICIRLMKAGESQDMTQDYIYIDTTNLKTNNRDAPKSKVPWLASQTDMLADDWEVFNELQVEKTSDGKIIFNRIDGVRCEELVKDLIDVKIILDDNELIFEARFYGFKIYQISKDTYDAFVKIIKKSWHLDV